MNDNDQEARAVLRQLAQQEQLAKTSGNAQNNSISQTQSAFGTIVWLLISQVVGLLSLLAWPFMLTASAYASDSSSSAAQLMLYVTLCYPVVAIGTAVAAWILLARKSRRAALIVTSVPLLFILPVVGIIVYALVVYRYRFGG